MSPHTQLKSVKCTAFIVHIHEILSHHTVVISHRDDVLTQTVYIRTNKNYAFIFDCLIYWLNIFYWFCFSATSVFCCSLLPAQHSTYVNANGWSRTHDHPCLFTFTKKNIQSVQLTEKARERQCVWERNTHEPSNLAFFFRCHSCAIYTRYNRFRLKPPSIFRWDLPWTCPLPPPPFNS